MNAHHHLDVLPMRSSLEAYLMEKANMSVIEAGALDDLQLCEHILALHGIACVSIETAAEIERIEALGYNVPLARLDAVIGAIYAGALAEYRRPLALV
jgi:hypothetical protein